MPSICEDLALSSETAPVIAPLACDAWNFPLQVCEQQVTEVCRLRRSILVAGHSSEFAGVTRYGAQFTTTSSLNKPISSSCRTYTHLYSRSSASVQLRRDKSARQ